MIDIFAFLAPNVVIRFQNITKVKFQPAAAYVLKLNGWDLDRSIMWYHDHKNDTELPKDLKEYLYENYIEERPGKQVCTFCYNITIASIYLILSGIVLINGHNFF